MKEKDLKKTTMNKLKPLTASETKDCFRGVEMSRTERPKGNLYVTFIESKNPPSENILYAGQEHVYLKIFRQAL